MKPTGGITTIEAKLAVLESGLSPVRDFRATATRDYQSRHLVCTRCGARHDLVTTDEDESGVRAFVEAHRHAN